MTPPPAAASPADAKRLALLNAALRCFVSIGFQATTAQVAREARVATGSLFNYFATKDLLIQATAAHVQDGLCQGLISGPAFPRDTVYDMLRRVWQALTLQAIGQPLALKYHLLYLATPGYSSFDSLLSPRLRAWRGVGNLLARTAQLTDREGDWSAVLLETQWLKSTQLLLASELADPSHPWGGAMSAYAFHNWWAGLGLLRTHPM